MLRILLGIAGERSDDEEGSVTGYTHKGEGRIVVLRIGGFLER